MRQIRGNLKKKMPLENLIRFPALGDWGGTEYASYYVPLQEWNAQLMDDLCIGL